MALLSETGLHLSDLNGEHTWRMISWGTCHCLKNKIKFHVYRPISAPSVVQSFAVLFIIHVKSILVLFGLATFDFLCSLFVLSIKSKTPTFVFFVFFMNHKIMYKYWFISYDMHSHTCDIYSCVTMLVYFFKLFKM